MTETGLARPRRMKRSRLCALVASIVTFGALATAGQASAYTWADVGKYDWGWQPIGHLAEKIRHSGSALNILEGRYKVDYVRNQDEIRARFKRDYWIGNPSTLVRVAAGPTTVVLYQQFSGGSWGNSILVPCCDRLAILDPRAWFTDRLYLVSGVIYEKWMRIGNFQNLGGPKRNQYRTNDGFIRQNFAKGAIGFRPGSPRVWWAPYGQGWRQ